MEILRESYDPIEGSESEDEDTNFEKLVQKYIETNNHVNSLKNDLSGTRAQQNSLAKQLKESFIHTLDQKILINHVLKIFDESGDFLGLDDRIHHVLQTKGLNTDAIMESVEQCVSQLITCTHDISPVTLRRWNIHILAVITKLIDKTNENEDIERLGIVAASVFEHLANYDHDWRDVTNNELQILRDVCNSSLSDPLSFTKLVSKVFNNFM